MFDIYTLTAVSFFLFSIVFWGKKLSNPNVGFLFLICLLWLIIHDGFRWEIGTDWNPYKAFFDTRRGENHMGIAYGIMNQAIHYVSDSYTAVTLLIAIIMYTILGLYFIKKYSPQPFMSLCIMYTGLLGMMGCNRQLLALMCCLLSLQFIFKRKFIKFAALTFLATAFHITALLFLPAYFLYNLRYKNIALIIIVVLAFLIGISHVVNHLPFVDTLAMLDALSNNSTSLSSYFTEEEAFGTSIIGSFKRILFVILALRFRSIIHNKMYDYVVLMYTIGAIIYLCFNGSMLQIMAGRGCLYYNIFEIIWIPYMIMKFPIRQKSLRLVIWLAFFVFNFYIMQRDMNSYFIQDGVDIYRPYKSVLY